MGAMVVAGLLSGLVGHLALEHGVLDRLRVFDVPLVVGLAYAAIVGGWLAVRGPGRSPAIVGWAALVVAAWVAAVRVGAEIVDPFDVVLRGRAATGLAGAVAGCVGAAIVAVANVLVLPATRSARAFLTVAGVGTAAGLVVTVSDSFLPLLLVWQGAVTGATAYVAERA